jgi:protein-tyrosine phosphatase
MNISFVDIHCHMLPGIDDGAKSWEESLAMAQLTVEEGTTTVIATPHQLGNFSHNRGEDIRRLVAELQQRLNQSKTPLTILAGADVRIEPEMTAGLASGDVLTLGDHRRHVLLELPHELYLPLEPVLHDLSRRKITGVLSHPERNQGILRDPDVLASLIEDGCLLQITAGSLCGTFGSQSQQFCEWLLSQGMVHFVATDAHGPKSRRPLMRRAFDRVVALAGEAIAIEICSHNPGQVATGQAVKPGRRAVVRQRRGWGLRRAIA